MPVEFLITMKCQFLVFAETQTHREAGVKKGMPVAAQDVTALLLLDFSEPAESRMRDMLQYTLRGDELMWKGKTQGKVIEVAFFGLFTGNAGKPYLQGKILGLAAGSK